MTQTHGSDARVEALARRMRAERAIAILRWDDENVARRAMAAAVEGGFRVVEFTMNTPGALRLVEEFARDDRLLVGAGTVLDPEQVARVRDAGGRFVVSPVTDEAVVRTALDLGLLPVPGGFTAAELLRARRLGAPLQKLFPAPTDGPAYLRALLGPLPDLALVPTSGVDADNARAFLEAGAAALGFVRPLFEPDDLASSRFDAVRARARRLLSACGIAAA